jgi:nucleotide-binding universal stress UspA family protein
MSPEPAQEPRVEQIMTSPLIRIGPDDPLREAATAMAERGVHALIVEPSAAGSEPRVLSDGDLVDALAGGADPDGVVAGEIAATEAPTVERGETLGRAAQLLDEHEVGHLLVVEAGGEPVGVVSTLDVLGALPEPERPRHPAPRPRSVVVAHEGEASGDDAVALGRLLVGRRGRIKVVTVMPFSMRAAGGEGRAADWRELEQRLHAQGERMLAERALPALQGRAGSFEVLLDDSPARALSILCDRERPDLLVFGSSHRGPLGRILLGSTASRLLNGVAASVAVAPRGYASEAPASIGRIAVGFDGSAQAERALEEAVRLAVDADARLLVAGAIEPPAVLTTEIGRQALRSLSGEQLRDRRRDLLTARIRERLDAIEDAPQWECEVRHGDPATVLRELTEEGVDLLVLGSRGYGPLRRALLGSVSGRLIGETSCPVLVVAQT